MYIWMIVFMIYGIVIGSFLNVCIYRIPKEESVITNRSHCMECGEQIKWYDLIPLASYIVLGGKCRSCKTKISIQYPLIEFVNGFGYAIIILTNGVGLKSILYCLCASAMLALSVIDWRTFEIPVAFNIFIGILGIIRLLTDIEHWHTYVIGFVSVSGFLYLIYIITKGRGIGG
ncbi:MAG: prepilin peptidase, partial [Lachnospiraceae bacterium]|nr:prepilin peptidase [Lachnospiraceae bacterium]